MNSGLSLQLSTRRLAPNRQMLKETLVVLSPKSRERINNEVKGRVSEDGLYFPVISPAHCSSPIIPKANSKRLYLPNLPKPSLIPRFNEPLSSPRPRKTLQKAGGSEPRLHKIQTQKLFCSKISQTDFSLEGCEPWTVTEMGEAFLPAWRSE